MKSETPPADERELLEALQRLLVTRLPADWAISLERGPLPDLRDLGVRPDAWLTVAPPTSLPARFLVEAKMSLYPRDASVRFGSTWAQITRTRNRAGTPPGAAPLLVVSRFLAPSTRDILRRSGVSYADATGNLRLESRDPALFVELSGASSDPWKSERPLRSLKGPGTARIVRALLDYQPPFKLRDLALSADLPLATASRVVSYLVEEALVSRDGRGPIESVAWQQLLRQWATEYPLLAANQAEFFLEPRGPRALLDRLREVDLDYAVTGSLAAEQKVRFAPAALASVYVPDIRRAAEALGLRPAPSGGNVVLVAPASGVAFERIWSDGPTTYAALSQVAADLLASPGRAPSEAEALIEWMEGNESAWRRA
jgi:hypothetical protein